MIICLMAASLAGFQTPAPAKLVSNMLGVYHEAKSIVGSIKMTQSAMGKELVTETQLQFEKPDRIFIRQVRGGSTPMSWLATSDGVNMSYDVPNDIRESNWVKDRRLVEPLQQRDFKLGFTDIYSAFVRSLGDRSAPLDIAFSRIEDLEFLRFQWATVEDGGKVNLNGEELDCVRGKWRLYADVPATGTYQMLLTKEGNLRRYSVREAVQVQINANQSSGPQEITTVWDVKLQINGKPDPALFKIVRN